MERCRIEGIYSNYSDESLKKEFIVLNNIMDIENVEDTILMESVDEIYIPLLEEIAQRYVSAFGKNVIYLNLNN